MGEDGVNESIDTALACKHERKRSSAFAFMFVH